MQIIATVEGENAGPPWWWAVRLRDNRAALITGDCDFTGWDCQSGASSVVVNISENTPAIQKLIDVYIFNSLEIEECVDEEFTDEVQIELLRQELAGRQKTRREVVGEDLFRSL